jgi:HPt (histidine-containing phosphotransfer) domain-containing protein
MGSIKHRRSDRSLRSPSPADIPGKQAPSISTATLSELFTTRLQSERVHFVTLSAALARAEECPGGIFDDLNFRAHRLKGAAATFEFPELARAAGALERASFAAATVHAAHTDTDVWTALVALVDILGVIEQPPRTPDLQWARRAD